jgi:uncharacterized protein (DUF1330 family)
VIRRLRPRAIRALWRSDVPAPVDVVNLIVSGDMRSYRRYGLLVAPVLLAVGGRPLWMGRREHVVAGAPAADKLMIVRYPSHRRFLVMTMSPWWQAINGYRERGVTAFAAAFTHASHVEPRFGRRAAFLGVHFDGDLDRVTAAVGLPLVYASSQTARLDLILDDLRATDPNPPRHAGLACFAVDPGWEAPASLSLDGCDAAVYVRESPL